MTLFSLFHFLPTTSAALEHDGALAARLDAHAQGLMVREQVPGAIAAIVAGEKVILRGYGFADLENGRPVGPDDTRFEIGSVTKLFTWIAVMMLVEEGALELQDDIAEHLPGFDLPGTVTLTMAHLMSHRPGFEESYAIFDPLIAALPRRQALEATVPEQVFPPGEVTSYSNWGVALAGVVIEEVSGQTWEEFVKERILAPLGMDNTTLGEHLRGPDQPPLSQSYRVQDGVARPAFRIDLGAFAPAGSVASTADDMARFLQFLLGDGSFGGRRLLRPETVERMHTRLFDDRPDAPDMAHGFQSRPKFGTTFYGHGGGWNEFRSNLVFVPEIGAGVFISQNGGTGISFPFIAADLILAELADSAGLAPLLPDSVPDAAARAQEAAGRYLNNRRTFTGWAQVSAALSPLVVTATPGGALMVPTNLLPVPSRFEPIATDLWQDALGNRIQAIRDPAGNVVRIADGTGAHTHDRAHGLDDPVWLGVGSFFAVFLALTTLLGLVWRRGLAGGATAGRLAAAIAHVGAASVVLFAGAVVAAALESMRLGTQYVFDRPQPTLQAVLAGADALTVLAMAVLLSLVIVWRVRGWSLWRRSHQTVFALSLAAFAVLLVHWGLAFGGPI